MLTQLAQAATDVLSLGELWPSVTVYPKTPVVTPAEPTTLALALAGIVTAALYLAVNGVRRQRSSAEIGPQTTPISAAKRQPRDMQRRPKRGAA
jgi:hypothetical protein